MTAIPTTDPIQYRDSYFIQAKDATGKAGFYRIRIFEVDEKGNEQQISLTINQWQKIKQELQPTLSPFLEGPNAVPEKFSVTMHQDNNLELTSRVRPDIRQFLHKDNPTLGKTCNMFRSVIHGETVRYSADLLKIPSLPDEMKDLDIDLNARPIGIHNEGDDCPFAYLQAFVLDDEDLMKALWNDARSEGKTTEIGRFLYLYRKAQKEGKSAIYGVHQLRNALIRSNRTTDYKQGQFDPTEAFSFLFDSNKFSSPHLQKNGQTNKIYWTCPAEMTNEELHLQLLSKGSEAEIDAKGVYTTTQQDFTGTLHINRQENLSLEQTILGSLDDKTPYEQELSSGKKITGQKIISLNAPSKHLIVPITNPERKPLASVSKTLTIPKEHFTNDTPHTYELTSFIQHRGSDNNSGHYVAYVKRGDLYFECNDSAISNPIEEAAFLEAAKNAYAVGYTRSS